jgi:hypothetical protein
VEKRFAKKRALSHRIKQQPYELFKFHRPANVLTVDPPPMVAIYNESRFHRFLIPYTGDSEEELFQGHLVVYAWGRFNMDANHFEFDRSRFPIRDPKDFPAW